MELLSGFSVNGYENLAERANQEWKEREREKVKLDPRRTRMPSQYQITTHPLPSSLSLRPTSSWWTRSRGCLAAGPTMGKSLQLYWNPGRTNVRPNSSINLQVNQGPPLPLPIHLSFLIPGWPSFYTPSRRLSKSKCSRSCMRGDVYTYAPDREQGTY